MKQTTAIATGGSLFEGYITAKELCKQIGQMKGGRPIARRTLERWHSLRVGPPRVRVGRIVVYRIDEVRAWLEEHSSRSFRKRRPRV